MNTYKIKITGTTEINAPLDDKQDYSIVLKRCAIKSTTVKKSDSTEGHSYTYNLENLDIATLIDEGGTINNGKAKSNAKRLRGAIWHLGEEKGVEDSEKFYNDMINKIIINLDKYETL